MSFIQLPEQASTMAPKVDALFYTWVALSAFATVVIVALLAYFAIKYRKGSRADRSHRVSGNWLLEFSWLLIPAFLFMGMWVWATQLYYMDFNPPANAMEIYVVGKQWMWHIQHTGGQREINELHVPVGQPVKLVMTSEDVIHSFYMPAFRIKQDVLPGRYTSEWFQATKPGEYHLFCAEYCGMGHARMTGKIVVMSPADYQAWLATGGPETSLVAGGKQLFTSLGCAGCHGGNGTVRAPDLTGIYGKPQPLSTGGTVIADDTYIQDSILFPKKQVVASYKPIMPSFKGQVSQEQLLQLVAYIKSLGAKERNTP